MSLYGLGISKRAAKRLQREDIRINREIDLMNTTWTFDLDYLVVVLMPRKWWSWTAWKLAIGIRKHVRLGFNPPVGK